MNPYNNKQSADEYLKFLSSTNGQIQQAILLEAITAALPANSDVQILDAACGSGWLAGSLTKSYKNVCAFDASPALIEHATTKYSTVKYSVANANENLPYNDKQFDVIILNMSATDLADPKTAYNQLQRILKSTGMLLITIPNPYYAYPVGIWKRGLIGRLLFKKPKLTIRPVPYNSKELLPSWGPRNPTSHYYSLADHINLVTQAGFHLNRLKELRSQNDSQKFNLQYQLYRFPLLLLLEFKNCLT